MSMTICSVCRGVFCSDADPDCWCGPDEDIPVCEACRDEEASYENQANPMRDIEATCQRIAAIGKELEAVDIPSVNFLTGKVKL